MRPQHLRSVAVCGILIMSAWLLGRDAHAQRAPRTHTIFMTAVEIKGSTTIDKLPPPAVNPLDQIAVSDFAKATEPPERTRR